jgi:Fe-S-cluster containining protein
VYLTEADILRAAAFLGMTAAAFERRYVYRTPRMRRLRVPRYTQCHFLGDAGCSIHPAKPTQCRIFPFWPELVASRREWNKTAQYCPGMGQGPLIQIEHARKQASEMKELYPELYIR